MAKTNSGLRRRNWSIDGMIDGKVNIRDREQVLEHYLEKNRWRLRQLIHRYWKTISAGEFKPTGRDKARQHELRLCPFCRRYACLGMGVSMSVENDISSACFRQK